MKPDLSLFKKIRHIQMQTTHLARDLFAGAYRSVFKGQGMEFEEVREYLPGDEVRSIDWKVTARMGRPFVKRFCEERELTLMLVVDLSASSYFGSGEKLKHEWMAEIAALLAFSAIKNNDQVGLLLFSSEVELYLSPKKGTRHVLRVLRELLAFTPKHRGTNLEGALTFLGRVQRKRGICFLISDFLTDPCERALLLAARHYDLISILIRDPEEKLFSPKGHVCVEDPETGAQLVVDMGDAETKQLFEESDRMRRAAHRALMKKIGGSTIEVDTDRSYLDPLRRFFHLRERHLRCR